ncbi:MAG: hypothetical protein BWZ10_02162 [candidate division BRC1 bacterium ADurb.BinA364]|nr:MAG: hypothetical protein BWZ10_02162 [candidate division BRC1 bacterium ADurb.BinA364]
MPGPGIVVVEGRLPGWAEQGVGQSRFDKRLAHLERFGRRVLFDAQIAVGVADADVGRLALDAGESLFVCLPLVPVAVLHDDNLPGDVDFGHARFEDSDRFGGDVRLAALFDPDASASRDRRGPSRRHFLDGRLPIAVGRQPSAALVPDSGHHGIGFLDKCVFVFAVGARHGQDMAGDPVRAIQRFEDRPIRRRAVAVVGVLGVVVVQRDKVLGRIEIRRSGAADHLFPQRIEILRQPGFAL